MPVRTTSELEEVFRLSWMGPQGILFRLGQTDYMDTYFCRTIQIINSCLSTVPVYVDMGPTAGLTSDDSTNKQGIDSDVEQKPRTLQICHKDREE